MRKEDVYSLLSKYAYDVDEQGAVGTCVAHTIRNLIKLHSKLQYDADVDVSFMDIYARRETGQGDNGMYPDKALSKVQTQGIAVKGIVKDCYTKDCINPKISDEVAFYRIKPIRRFSTYYTNSTQSLKEHLKQDFEQNGLRFHQISILSDAGWWNGVYPKITGRILGGHSLVIANIFYEENGNTHFVVVDSAYTKSFDYNIAKGWREPSEEVLQKVLKSYRIIEWKDKDNKFALLASVEIVYGERGSHVKLLQEYLISQGFKIPAGATGYFGEQTRKALSEWQKKYLFKDYGGRYWGKISQSVFKALSL